MGAMKWIRWAACLAMLTAGGAAGAGTITHTISGRGTFDLNGTSYVDQTFIFRGVSDTADLAPVDLEFNVLGGADVHVQAAVYFFFRDWGSYSFSRWSPLGDATVIGVMGAPLDGYVTSHAIDPVTVSAYFDAATFTTTGGDLRLRSIDGDVSFAATISGAAVPEPSTLALALIGLATCPALLRRLGRRALG